MLNRILQALFPSAQHLYEKEKDPDPYLWLKDGDPDGPKKMGIRMAQKHADPADPVPDPQHCKKVSQQESFSKDVNEAF